MGSTLPVVSGQAEARAYIPITADWEALTCMIRYHVDFIY